MLKIRIADGADGPDALASPLSSDGLVPKPGRQNHHVLQKFSWLLNFKDPKDGDLYTNALRDLFYFPTFVPIMLLIIIYGFSSADQDEIYLALEKGWALTWLHFICAKLSFLLLVVFTFAQMCDYIDIQRPIPLGLYRFSSYLLRTFMFGRIPDAILLFSAFAQGFNILLVAVGNFCAGCGDFYAIQFCGTSGVRYYPWQKVFFSYTIQLILPIFLKSTHRYSSATSMLVITAFMIIALIVGDYKFSGQLVVVVVIFNVSMFEFERYRMTSFLLSKEALTLEQSKQEKTKAEANAQLERRMNQALLQQILPPQVAKQLLSGQKVAPEQFEEVTIFFSDVVGFTNICAAVSPIQVVKMLNELYTVMDYCTSHFPLYKVETIGDAYMLVGGLPVRDTHHAQQIADFALLVSTAVQAVKSPVDGTPINIRIGVHSGSCMAGVVGNLMPRYCLFGDTVNTASRMESNGEPGKIHLSSTTADILQKTGKYIINERGAIPIKGKGIMTTYWLDKAHESNTNSNELAIAKLEVMVQEILQSNEQEEMQRDYDNNIGSGDDYDMEDMSVNSKAHVVDETNLFTSELGVIKEHQSSKSHMDVFNIEGGAGAGIDNAIHGTVSDVALSQPNKTPKSREGGSTPKDSYRQRAHSSPEKAHNRSSNSVASPRTNGSYRVGNKGQNPSPTQHSNPHALHSIRYNIAHKLSLGEDFTSSGAKILVVEDSPAQRKMLVKRLHVADSTWDVSQAISGEDALRMLQAARWTFDVVFVDENLSSDDGLFGHELVQVMRRQPQMLTTVIIACTSNPAVATEKLLAAGVDYVWPKPPPLPSVIKPKIDSLLAFRIKTYGNQNTSGAEL